MNFCPLCDGPFVAVTAGLSVTAGCSGEDEPADPPPSLPPHQILGTQQQGAEAEASSAGGPVLAVRHRTRWDGDDLTGLGA